MVPLLKKVSSQQRTKGVYMREKGGREGWGERDREICYLPSPYCLPSQLTTLPTNDPCTGLACTTNPTNLSAISQLISNLFTSKNA